MIKSIPLRLLTNERGFIQRLTKGSAVSPNNYFFNNSETSPIGNSSTSTYQWADGLSSGVSRVNTRAKNGTWSTKHTLVDPGDIQVGKVLKFMYPDISFPGPPFPNSTAWFSAWYYFDTTNGGWTDPGDWEIWTNHMQWKGANNINYQDGSPRVESDSKCSASMRYVDGTRRWVFGCDNPKWTASPSSDADTQFALGTFPHNIGTKQNAWSNTTFTVPLNEWVFLEIMLKMTKQNGHVKIWSGTASEGVLYLLHDMSHADLNFLKGWNQDPVEPNQWGTNLYLYFGIGNYQSTSHPSGTYDLFTDDARITDGQVGPSLPEFA